ncbi:hypothetical protein SAMN05421872_101572 [Nocardioides lianchengensis]|uniref:Uncharacterized protein n=1 Tax=Nocardioides lianchengensis TaxID=1045774 RepID=A0A1G6JSX2_9ACTN|nr:hypothetical protein SAMN05421872_101572 [Nocardioides lianchengensis]
MAVGNQDTEVVVVPGEVSDETTFVLGEPGETLPYVVTVQLLEHERSCFGQARRPVLSEEFDEHRQVVRLSRGA